MAKKLTPEEINAQIEMAKKIQELVLKGKTALSTPKIEDAPPVLQDIIRDFQIRQEKQPLFESPDTGPVEIKTVNKPTQFEFPTQSGQLNKSTVLSETPDVISEEVSSTPKTSYTLEDDIKLGKAIKAKKKYKHIKDQASNAAKEAMQEFADSVNPPKIPPVTPASATASTSAEKSLFDKFKDLPDETLSKLGPMGKKILENKYVQSGTKLGKVGFAAAEPFLAYDAYQDFKNELATPTTGLSEQEKSAKPYQVTGKAMDVAGLGLGTVGTAGELLGMASAAGLGTAGAGLLGGAAVVKTLPYLREGSKEVSKMPSGSMLGRLGYYEGQELNDPRAKKYFEKSQDYLDHLKKSGFTDEQLQNLIKQKEIQREPSSKRQTISSIVSAKDKLNHPLSDVLATIDVENPSYGLDTKNPGSTAEGIGQITNSAFTEAKKYDPELGKYSKEEMLKDPILQAKSIVGYKKHIANYIKTKLKMEPTEDLVNAMYNQGFITNKKAIELAEKGLDVNGRPIIDKSKSRGKTIEQQIEEQKRMGYDGPAAADYIKKHNQAKSKIEEELASGSFIGNRAPSSVAPEPVATESVTPEEQYKKEFSDYINAENEDEAMKALNVVFPMGPYTTAEQYGEVAKDKERLAKIREQYKKQPAPVPEVPAVDQKEIDDLNKQIADAGKEPSADSEGPDFGKLLEDQLKLESGFSKNNVETLEKKQDEADRLRALNLFVQGSQQLSRGIASLGGFTVKPGPEFKYLSDQADVLEKHFKESVEKEQEDPNSQYSASYRNFTKPILQQMGFKNVNIIDGMSGSQISKVFPQLKDMYEAKIRAEYVKAQKELTNQATQQYRDKNLQLKTEKFVNSAFDKNTKVEVDRLEGSKRPAEVINKIKSEIKTGKLKSSANIREQLNQEVSTLLLPANQRASVSALNRTQIDTYYGRINDLISKITGTPTDTITDAYLNQIQNELELLRGAYKKSLQTKVESLKGGVSDSYAKEILDRRAAPFLIDDVDFGYDPETEKKISMVMEKNPGATRDQVVKKLKAEGKLK